MEHALPEDCRDGYVYEGLIVNTAIHFAGI